MSYTIAYQERAILEYEMSMEWYRLRSERAAVNFEIAVKAKVNLLRAAPDSFKKTYRQFREVALNKYPFSIVYFVEEKKKTGDYHFYFPPQTQPWK